MHVIIIFQMLNIFFRIAFVLQNDSRVLGLDFIVYCLHCRAPTVYVWHLYVFAARPIYQRFECILWPRIEINTSETNTAARECDSFSQRMQFSSISIGS